MIPYNEAASDSIYLQYYNILRGIFLMFLVKTFDPSMKKNLKKRNKLPTTNDNIKRSEKGYPSIKIRKKQG